MRHHRNAICWQGIEHVTVFFSNRINRLHKLKVFALRIIYKRYRRLRNRAQAGDFTWMVHTQLDDCAAVV